MGKKGKRQDVVHRSRSGSPRPHTCPHCVFTISTNDSQWGNAVVSVHVARAHPLNFQVATGVPPHLCLPMTVGALAEMYTF